MFIFPVDLKYDQFSLTIKINNLKGLRKSEENQVRMTNSRLGY